LNGEAQLRRRLKELQIARPAGVDVDAVLAKEKSFAQRARLVSPEKAVRAISCFL
jgi:hypothetical protein